MLVIRKIISTAGEKVIAEIQVDTTAELTTSAKVVQTGAFYALSGSTWYNQDDTGAYS